MEKKKLRVKLKRWLMEQKLKERNVIDNILVLKQSFGFSNMVKREDADTNFSTLEMLDIMIEKYETLNTIIEDIERIDDVDIKYKARAFAPYIPKDHVEIDIEIDFYEYY